MRLDLSESDAAEVAGLLRAMHADNTRRLAKLFDPPERATAEVRENTYTHGLYRVRWADGKAIDPPNFLGEFTSEGEAEQSRQAYYLSEILAVKELADPETRTELTCPACGGTRFGYLEGCSQYWPGEEAGGDVESKVVPLFSIGWDGIGESGDGDPGLFCDNYRGGGCGIGIDLPEGWDYEFD